MVEMTLNDLQTKAKVIHFGTNRRLIYDFRYAAYSNFCSRTYLLATTSQTTDDNRRNTVAYGRLKTNPLTKIEQKNQKPSQKRLLTRAEKV